MDNQKKYIIALDQGTTSSRAIIFDKNIIVGWLGFLYNKVI